MVLLYRATVEGLDPMVNACVQVMHDVCSKVTEDGQLLQVEYVLPAYHSLA